MVRIELLWFEGCHNHEAARALLHALLAERRLSASIEDLEVPDEATGNRVRFPRLTDDPRERTRRRAGRRGVR